MVLPTPFPTDVFHRLLEFYFTPLYLVSNVIANDKMKENAEEKM